MLSVQPSHYELALIMEEFSQINIYQLVCKRAYTQISLPYNQMSISYNLNVE